MDRPRSFYQDTYHHVYNRCLENIILYKNPGDYKFFLRRMRKYKQRYAISVICYCLMPNHFHLFVKQCSANHTISHFCSSLKNSYTKAYNQKYKRTGVVFESRVKSKIIDNQNYFLELVKYILNNPVRKSMVSSPEQWEYSSAKDYFGLRNGTMNDMHEILNQFESENDFFNWVKGEDRFDATAFY